MAILSCNFISKSLGRTVPFTAVIPTIDFITMVDPQSKPYEDVKPFKTLYLLHGIGNNHIDWLAGTRVAHYAEEKGLAVIMPAGENGFYTDNNESDRYGEYVGEEIVKATRAIFNLSHKKEDTYIGGLSMGGYGAIRNGLKYCDTFSKIIGLSSGMIEDMVLTSTNDDPIFFRRKDYYEQVFGDITKLKGSDMDLFALADKNADKVKMYLACGTEDFLIASNREYRDHLTGIKADFIYEEGPGGHEWAFWDTYIEKAIKWIFE